MKSRMLRRRCPKCGGNLLYFDDFEETYLQCLQCSKILYFDDPDSYEDLPFKVEEKVMVSSHV